MQEVSASVIEELRARYGARLSTSEAILDQHGRDESYHPSAPPDAVFFAESTEEVADVVGACAAARIPVIPFGAGTSLEGHVGALQGGISIDLTRMTKVLEVNSSDLDCRVEAGLTRLALAQRLAPEGLFFAVDPGADATIGGMTATRASGTSAVRYGTMRENVLGLTVVLGDGRVIRTGGRARKSAAGYDLTRLFVGSEGTLGVITEVALRLFGIPEVIASATCAFETIEGAVDSVIETVQLGIPVARIELLDEVQVRACNSYSQTGLPEVPMLFIELHGSEPGTREQAEALAEIFGGHGGSGFAWATSTEERNAIWRARHEAYYAALHLVPGAKGFITDVCVPISRLAECLVETKRDLEELVPAGADRRPCRGRELPRHVADRSRRRESPRRSTPPERADGRARARPRRHDDRRARRRLRQDRLHRAGARAGGRGDAGPEGRARPELDPQPGEDLSLSRSSRTSSRRGSVSQSPVPASAPAAITLPALAHSAGLHPASRP